MLLVIPNMNLLIPHGFESNYVVGFARGLVAQGIALLVATDDQAAAGLQRLGIPHLNLRGSVDPGRSGILKLVNILRYYLLLLWLIFRHRGATIHFCGVLRSHLILFEGLIIPIWLRLWAGRYIHTAHNVLPHSRETSRIFRAAYKWIYRFPDVIVAHTEKVAGQLEQEFGVSARRLKVISIGLNEEVPDTNLSPSDARRQLSLPTDTPLALFFGKIEPYKGLDLLIKAWSQVRTENARLLIVGSCRDSRYCETIRGAINCSPKASAIEWREGFVPNELVALWFASCDVAVLPYRNIYQSGVVFLCLRFGIPVVATDVGSLRDYIHEEGGIIAERSDAASLAAAVDRFFENQTRFDREAIVRSAAKYSWAEQCRGLRELYV